MKTLLIATHNRNKIREYAEILAPLGYEVKSPADYGITEEAEENGKDYRENAYAKAKFIADRLKMPVIADDSGIEIKALGEHFPGIHSARWAKTISPSGDYHVVNQHVLELLKGAKDRSAEYHCCIVLLRHPDDAPLYYEGVCKGHILEEIKGSHGFGYDPIFHYDAGNLDFGMCSDEEKNRVSHRGKATRELLAFLSEPHLV